MYLFSLNILDVTSTYLNFIYMINGIKKGKLRWLYSNLF